MTAMLFYLEEPRYRTLSLFSEALVQWFYFPPPRKGHALQRGIVLPRCFLKIRWVLYQKNLILSWSKLSLSLLTPSKVAENWRVAKDYTEANLDLPFFYLDQGFLVLALMIFCAG